jgi:hypothetical protein
VTVETATLLPPDSQAATRVTAVTAWPAGGGDHPGAALPQTVPGRRALWVEVRLKGPRPCTPATPASPTAPTLTPQTVEVTWSTPLGLRRAGPAPVAGGTAYGNGGFDPCAELPTGPPPADPAAAEADIARAFATVYGGPRNPDVKRQRIDVFDGLDGVAAEAYRRGHGEQLESTRAAVERVSFDRPDHAWVVYQLGAGDTTVGFRKGEAVLVDGTWKVTRATVCRDLGLTGVTCP